jgi:hypothetical protein
MPCGWPAWALAIVWHRDVMPEVDFDELAQAPGKYEDMGVGPAVPAASDPPRRRQGRRRRPRLLLHRRARHRRLRAEELHRPHDADAAATSQEVAREGDEEEPTDLDADRADRPDPGEQIWFDSLGEGLPAQLDWLGKNWLKEQLAWFPDIVRYFSGAADEVVRILTEISREDARPGDAAGVAQRFVGQASRLNEIDPYYWFEFGVAGEMVTVTAHPKYPDAPLDRPITMTTTLQFDDSPGQQEAREAFEDFMKFGTPVTIPPASIIRLTMDAPGGLGGEFEGSTLILDGTFSPGSERATAILLRVPVQPPVRQVIRMSVTNRSSGPAGGLLLTSRDPSGLLIMEQRFDTVRRTHRARLTYRYHDGALPQDALPVLRFCAAVAAGQEMAITDPAGNVITTSSGSFGAASWPEGYVRCVELLAKIQQLTGTPFPMPDAFTAEDQRDMHYAQAILRGEDVHAQWSGMIAPLAGLAVDSLLAQVDRHGERFMFAAAVPETLSVAGGQLPLGSVLHIMHSTHGSPTWTRFGHGGWPPPTAASTCGWSQAAIET